VEIQIRTGLQDMWAQITEKLADKWGRGIRYGEDPENPDAEVRAGRLAARTRREVIEMLGTLSYHAAKVEEGQLSAIKAQQSIDTAIQNMRDVKLPNSSSNLLDAELPPEIARTTIDAVRKLLDSSPQGRDLVLPQSMTLRGRADWCDLRGSGVS